jgi:hypothetical protein
MKTFKELTDEINDTISDPAYHLSVEVRKDILGNPEWVVSVGGKEITAFKNRDDASWAATLFFFGKNAGSKTGYDILTRKFMYNEQTQKVEPMNSTKRGFFSRLLGG